MIPTRAKVKGTKSPVAIDANAGGKHVNSTAIVKISQT